MKTKKCPKCDTLYLDKQVKCPQCDYQEPINKTKMAIYIIVCLQIIFASIFVIFKYEIPSKLLLVNHHIEVIIFSLEKKRTNPKDNIYIKPKRMTEFSGLSKEEFLKHRQVVVQHSPVFKNIKNYTPNQDVYKIEDNLPWISAYELIKNGTKNSKDIGKGVSRHSMMVNNPELLLGYIVPEYNSFKYKYEPDNTIYFFPKSIFWNKKTNTIKVYFDYKSYIEKVGSYQVFFMPDETNARDFGYNWIYCKRKSGIKFKNKNNISKNIYNMSGYYAKGYACGAKEGCNNYAPNQDDMDFVIKLLGGYAKFKLWKEKPKTIFDKADINYEMYFY